MLFSCLGFVLFGWLSAVYVVFPAWTLPSYFSPIVTFRNRNFRVQHWFLAKYVLLYRIFKYPVNIHDQLINRAYNAKLIKRKEKTIINETLILYDFLKNVNCDMIWLNGFYWKTVSNNFSFYFFYLIEQVMCHILTTFEKHSCTVWFSYYNPFT